MTHSTDLTELKRVAEAANGAVELLAATDAVRDYLGAIDPPTVLALIAAAEERDALKARLEIANGEPVDGIECRDETIRLADARIAKLKARVAALESVVNMADQMREGVRKAGVKREQALYIHVMAYDVARALLEPGK